MIVKIYVAPFCCLYVCEEYWNGGPGLGVKVSALVILPGSRYTKASVQARFS